MTILAYIFHGPVSTESPILFIGTAAIAAIAGMTAFITASVAYVEGEISWWVPFLLSLLCVAATLVQWL